MINKAIPLALCLPLIWSVQCEAFVSKPRCLPDCGIVKEQIQKFYCVATQIYEELKIVRASLFYTLFTYSNMHVFQQNPDYLLQPILSENEFNKHSVSIMLDMFSDTCKMHTAVMMYSHQLGEYVSEDPNNHLYSISATLQNAASILETIEV